MEVEVLQHLLILCCYGGVPYIDYQQLGSSNNNNNFKHESTMSLDPTDWIAIDSSGSLLNNTIHPEILSKNPLLSLLIPPNTSLDQCDLYNLTFSSAGDEHLYELGHGKLSCRCPLSRTGVACQSHLNLPQALALSSSNSNMGSDPFASYMLASIFLMVAMILLFFSMMKGCFCDCFGGFQNPFKRNTDKPIDPVAISRCLHAVNEYEEKQKLGYPDQVNRPLITSVSENFAAPYNDTVYSTSQYPSAPPPPPRNASPPPSYRSQNGSMEYLPGATAKTQL